MVQTDPNLYTNDEFYYKFLFKNVRQVSVVYACRMWTFMANGNKCLLSVSDPMLFYIWKGHHCNS